MGQKSALFSCPAATAAGVVCPRCKTAAFTTTWQTLPDKTRSVRMDCVACGAFVRLLPQRRDGTPDFQHQPRPADAHARDLAPPPDGWSWLGFIRQSDQVWRPVALAASLPGCWDCLLTFPGRGDLLCVPVRPDGWPAALDPEADPEGPAFVGWRRDDRRSPWRQEAQGATEDEAWQAMLREPSKSDVLVLPRGRRPETRDQGGKRRS